MRRTAIDVLVGVGNIMKGWYWFVLVWKVSIRMYVCVDGWGYLSSAGCSLLEVDSRRVKSVVPTAD